MRLNPININPESYPEILHPILKNSQIFDSSCSKEAVVVYVEKESGYFLKSAKKGTLADEAVMTRFFHSRGLAAKVLYYISEEKDYLLTEKINGDDCTAAKYLDVPERLCDILAERLALLHSVDCTGCPVHNQTERYLNRVIYNYENELYDKTHFPDNWGFSNADEAWVVVESCSSLLQTDTLLHGDYCLPNIILNNWEFSGFIDLGNSGAGDRYVDLFWALWSLSYNLKTDKYRKRFLDAYGLKNFDEEKMRLISAAEVFS